MRWQQRGMKFWRDVTMLIVGTRAGAYAEARVSAIYGTLSLVAGPVEWNNWLLDYLANESGMG